MSTLKITLLGSMRISYAEGSPEVRVTRTSQLLLAYLLLQRHRVHSRDVLADLLWEDLSQDQARGCLSTALWRLRHVLEPKGTLHGHYVVTTSAGEIGFNAESDYWLDVALLEQEVLRVRALPTASMSAADAQALAQVLQLYVGDLLEGCYYDWVLREQERLRCLYLDGLKHLMSYHSQRRSYDESLECGRRILALDPLREEIHREMMRLYLENGQRVLALRQYESCRDTLAAEMGIAPMEETQAIFARIAEQSADHVGPSTHARRPISLHQALRQLQLAVSSFDEARERVQHAIQLVEHLTEGTPS